MGNQIETFVQCENLIKIYQVADVEAVALQGNMDPCTLYASPDAIRRSVAEILEAYGQGTGHVFNLGHGIHPAIPPEHAGAMIDAVHELSRPFHA